MTNKSKKEAGRKRKERKDIKRSNSKD